MDEHPNCIPPVNYTLPLTKSFFEKLKLLARLPGVRQELVALLERMIGNSGEHIFEIGERLHIMLFCCGDQRVNHRCAASAVMRTGKQIVPAAKRQRPNQILDQVIVALQYAVFDVMNEPRPLRQGITDS